MNSLPSKTSIAKERIRHICKGCTSRLCEPNIRSVVNQCCFDSLLCMCVGQSLCGYASRASTPNLRPLRREMNSTIMFVIFVGAPPVTTFLSFPSLPVFLVVFLVVSLVVPLVCFHLGHLGLILCSGSYLCCMSSRS